MKKQVETGFRVHLYECSRHIGENARIDVVLDQWVSNDSEDALFVLSYLIESTDKSVCYPMPRHRIVLDANSPSVAVDQTIEAVEAFSKNPVRHFLAWFYDFSSLECGL